MSHVTDHAVLAPDFLRAVLRYEPETGKLYWRERTPDMFKPGKPGCRVARTPDHICTGWNGRHAGNEAFTTNSGGYRTGRLSGRTVKAHRIAWAIHHGEWPKGSIDHINGDPADNRIANLRDVSHSMNMRNTAARSDNKSGYSGVRWCRRAQKWIVAIQIGRFSKIEDAVAARDAARAALDLGFTGRSDNVPG